MGNLQTPVGSADHIQGDGQAPVILVEYGDYECPACGEAFSIVKAVQKHFGGKLGFVFRNFPLTQIHAQAESAAEAAEFFGANGRFWEAHDALYEHQGELGLPLYRALAEAMNLSPAELTEALEKRAYRPKVRSDFMGGLKSGVNGTPTFFINGKRHDGSSDFDSLVAAIDAELERPTATGS
jgi:protein-disulfide isomerase